MGVPDERKFRNGEGFEDFYNTIHIQFQANIQVLRNDNGKVCLHNYIGEYLLKHECTKLHV